MGKINDFFWTEDYVSRVVYQKWGENSLWFMDQEMVKFSFDFRKALNKPVNINTWREGGTFVGSGFRDQSVKEWKPFSQHSFGRAIDLRVSGMTSFELVDFLIKNRSKFPMITSYEDPDDTVVKNAQGIAVGGWLHVDKRHTGMADLFKVNPIK